jgi:hypothetical protein
VRKLYVLKDVPLLGFFRPWLRSRIIGEDSCRGSERPSSRPLLPRTCLPGVMDETLGQPLCSRTS